MASSKELVASSIELVASPIELVTSSIELVARSIELVLYIYIYIYIYQDDFKKAATGPKVADNDSDLGRFSMSNEGTKHADVFHVLKYLNACRQYVLFLQLEVLARLWRAGPTNKYQPTPLLGRMQTSWLECFAKSHLKPPMALATTTG